MFMQSLSRPCPNNMGGAGDRDVPGPRLLYAVPPGRPGCVAAFQSCPLSTISTTRST